MMLIVLDKNPIIAADLVPKNIRHKQLLELMQMLSCVVNFGYKQIPQGKEIKEWISNHKIWVLNYAERLLRYLSKEQKLKEKTKIKYNCILNLLWLQCLKGENYPTTAILRYKEGYECKYPTNTELPINEAVEIYNDYVHNFKRWE